MVLLESEMGVARHLEGPPSEQHSVEEKAGVRRALGVTAGLPYVEGVKADVRYVAPRPRKRAVRHLEYVLEHEACLAPPASQQQRVDVPILSHMAPGGVILDRKRAICQFLNQRRQ